MQYELQNDPFVTNHPVLQDHNRPHQHVPSKTKVKNPLEGS